MRLPMMRWRPEYRDIPERFHILIMVSHTALSAFVSMALYMKIQRSSGKPTSSAAYTLLLCCLALVEREVKRQRLIFLPVENSSTVKHQLSAADCLN